MHIYNQTNLQNIVANKSSGYFILILASVSNVMSNESSAIYKQNVKGMVSFHAEE